MSTPAKAHLEPWDIYGNWTINEIKLDEDVSSIGISKKAKFKIVDGFVLYKKPDARKVRWNGDESKIQLDEVKDKLDRTSGFVLRANIRLGNVEHELLLGSKDFGVTLMVQLRKPGEVVPTPGGEGTAGRP